MLHGAAERNECLSHSHAGWWKSEKSERPRAAVSVSSVCSSFVSVVALPGSHAMLQTVSTRAMVRTGEGWGRSRLMELSNWFTLQEAAGHAF